MALILTEPGFRAAGRPLTRQPAVNHPPSFNKFRMSGGVDGRATASPPPTGQFAANLAAGYLAAAHTAHPELVEGWPRVAGRTAAANRPQLIPVEPATDGEGGV